MKSENFRSKFLLAIPLSLLLNLVSIGPTYAAVNENSSCASMAVSVFKSYGASLGSVFKIILNSDPSWSINPGWTNVAQKKVGNVTICDGS
jgi:hypothetical protein